MTSKDQLTDQIIEELQLAQVTEPKEPAGSKRLWFPPTLPLGDGSQLRATDKMIELVDDYADLLTANATWIARSFSRKDMRNLTRRAFGKVLAKIELDDPPAQNRVLVVEKVEELIGREQAEATKGQEFLFGAWFLRGHGPHDIEIGPVRLIDRASWLAGIGADKLSATSRRRLAKRWQGARLAKRKSSRDQAIEDATAEAIGDCPTACVVRTAGLSGEFAESKALFVARLAQTAIALMWEMPAAALNGLNLLYDGDSHRRRYVMFGDRGIATSSSIGRLPGGPPISEDWDTLWTDHQWMIAPIGEALSCHVDTSRQTARPTMLRALVMSLWWFHQGCREPSPLMAAVQFASSMDVLANGKKRAGITKMIEARLGVAPGAALTRGGRTTSDVVGEIYDYARSRTVHGSNDKLDHDWTSTRDLAERLSTLCIRLACAWMDENPTSDDLDALRRP